MAIDLDAVRDVCRGCGGIGVAPAIVMMMVDEIVALRIAVDEQRQCRLANEAELQRADAIIGGLREALRDAADDLAHAAHGAPLSNASLAAEIARKRLNGAT